MATQQQSRNTISVTWDTYQQMEVLRAKLGGQAKNFVSMDAVIKHLLKVAKEWKNE